MMGFIIFIIAGIGAIFIQTLVIEPGYRVRVKRTPWETLITIRPRDRGVRLVIRIRG